MFSINVISGVGVQDPSSNKLDFFCTINFNDSELFRTKVCSDTSDPIWNDIFEKTTNHFRIKEKDYNRSAYFEKLIIEVHSYKDKNTSTCIGEFRVPLLNIGSPQWYKICSRSAHHENYKEGYILLGLALSEDIRDEFSTTNYMPLNKAVPENFFVLHSPMFLTFGWSPLALVGMFNLPGPITGEVIHDRHENVEVSLTLHYYKILHIIQEEYTVIFIQT
jgi:hypothetical protein